MSGENLQEIRGIIARNKLVDKVFAIISLLTVFVAVITLLALVIQLAK